MSVNNQREMNRRILERIASDAQEFTAAIDDLLKSEANRKQWLEKVDTFLATMSWDQTWAKMSL